MTDSVSQSVKVCALIKNHELGRGTGGERWMDWLRAFLDFNAWGGGHLPGVTSRKPRTVLWQCAALTRIGGAHND